jgi:hypothetical protein
MKKMIMALALSLSIFAGSAFANVTEVNPKVIKAFNNEFVSAVEVNWTAGEGFYKASFILNSKYVFAYYTEEGKFLGLTRYMGTAELPMMLQNSIKKHYADFWVSDLFEVAKTGGSAYYLTVEDAENVLTLKAEGDSDWSVFKKSKKQ